MKWEYWATAPRHSTSVAQPDIEQWSQSSGPDVILRRARPGLVGLRPHTQHESWVVGMQVTPDEVGVLGNCAEVLHQRAMQQHANVTKVALQSERRRIQSE